MQSTPRRDFLLVLLLASFIAAASSRPFAGGWNDGSRLATIECLVDYGTFAIDNSVFVAVPAENAPFTSYDPILHKTGTKDKMWFHGHFYSDKSPVPVLYAAAIYKGLQLATGLNACRDSAIFCWLMHFLNSGLAYIIAVVSMYLTFRALGLPRRMIGLLVVAFALGTVALAYAKYVNAHIFLLGITSLMIWRMGRVGRQCEMTGRPVSWRSWLEIGTLCGIAYTIDLAAGPIVCLGVGGWVLFRMRSAPGWPRRIGVIAAVGLSALPWVTLHHAINFAVFGVIGPANSDPAMFTWPGSPFSATNMTGVWNHKTTIAFVLYALDILVGQRGFLGNNLMLYLAMGGLPILFRRRFREKPEFLCGLFWCAGTFLLYATLSNNYAGGCLSIRWFVPLLAPGFFALALLLRHRPDFTGDFLILCSWNLVWILPAWWYGPWWRPSLYLYWFVMAGGLIHWTIHHHRRVWRTQPNWRRPGFLLQFVTLGGNHTITRPHGQTSWELQHVSAEKTVGSVRRTECLADRQSIAGVGHPSADGR